MEEMIMKKKTKAGLYISCLGVVLSIILVVFQALTPEPMTTGVVILFANITILFSNLSRYKKQHDDNNL